MCVCYNSAKRGYSIWWDPILSLGARTKFRCHSRQRYEGKYELRTMIGTVHYTLKVLCSELTGEKRCNYRFPY